MPVAPTTAHSAGSVELRRSHSDAQRGQRRARPPVARRDSAASGTGQRRTRPACDPTRRPRGCDGSAAARPSAVGEQVERCRVGDRDRDDVAGTRNVRAAGSDLEVHEAVVFCPTGQAMGLGILLALAHRDQHLDLTAELLLVLFERDPLLQRDQPVVALLHDALSGPGRASSPPACPRGSSTGR